MTTRNFAWFVPALLLLCGCPGGDEEVAQQNPPPAPPPVVQLSTDGETADGSEPADGNEPADGTPAIGQPEPVVDTPASQPTRHAAEGTLAAYAVPLSMVTADHFLVAKLDAAKMRTSPLLQAITPEGADVNEGLELFANEQMGPGAGALANEVEVMWVALSPGPGKFEDFMGVATEEARPSEPSFEEFNEGDFSTEGLDDQFDPTNPCSQDEEFGAVAEDEPLVLDGEGFGAAVEEEPLILDGAGFGEPEIDEPDFGGPGPGPDDFGPPGPMEMPPLPINACIYIKFKTAQGLNAMFEMPPLDRDAPKVERNGRSYQKSPMGPIWYLAGKDDLFICTEEKLIQNVIDADGKIVDAPMIKRLQLTNIDAQLVMVADDTVGQIATQVAQALEEDLPAQASMAIRDMAGLSLAIDVDSDTMIDLQVDGKDLESAQRLNQLAVGLKSGGNIALSFAMAETQDSGAPASVIEMFKMGQQALASVAIGSSDTTIGVSLPRPANLEESLATSMAAMREEARRMAQLNNGRYLGIASWNHESVFGKFPSNIEKDGKELLSWRVALLPYLEENVLYREVKRDEPWDSEHNAQVLDIELAMYSTDSSPDKKHTTWRMMPYEGRAPVSDQILFIDAGKGAEVPWAKPDTFAIDPTNPIAAFGEEPEGGYIAVYGDAHVERISREQLQENLTKRYANAQPTTETETPAPAVRVWTAFTGTTLKATLVKFEDGQVTLKRADTGKEVTLPADKLSPEDQEYLKTLSP